LSHRRGPKLAVELQPFASVGASWAPSPDHFAGLFFVALGPDFDVVCNRTLAALQAKRALRTLVDLHIRHLDLERVGLQLQGSFGVSALLPLWTRKTDRPRVPTLGLRASVTPEVSGLNDVGVAIAGGDKVAQKFRFAFRARKTRRGLPDTNGPCAIQTKSAVLWCSREPSESTAPSVVAERAIIMLGAGLIAAEYPRSQSCVE
jgi:hypothetical protein